MYVLYFEYGRHRTSQEIFIPIGFIKLLTASVLRKQKKSFTISLRIDIHKIQKFSGYLEYQSFVSCFSQNADLITCLQENSTTVLYKIRYIFFRLKERQKLQAP